MPVNNIKLNNGVLMPEIGLGTWKANEEGTLAKTIKTAIDLGYRHIDCAKIYGNQKEIGSALSELKVPRNELFIVSKIWQNKHRPELVEGALDEILEELQLEYLDLLLIHWPYALKPERDDLVFTADDLDNVPIVDTWKAMEALLDTGKVRSIGVSNFNKAILEKLIPQCRIVPAVNQVEIHPYNQGNELVDYCQKNGINITGYCPLGGSKITVMDDEFIKSVAEAHACTPAQVALSWALSRGIAVIPKSTSPTRLKQNLNKVDLSADELRMFAKITKHERKVDPARDIRELEWIFHEDKAQCPLI
ncbi:NADP-dependent oxidoreductase domain-containing protein [Kickxella alabastrina]|uniref:NADP-dependent oxidoreductase domain-containing protein n=1 Tax=Kickxella alabastrina TaxID=61397 RepID=UPI0022209A83|nr:NADP-dependent oxidoreductase domain-containing protein [Kickxella alabastrina]KAI7834976.1 NADP-dependent oxidoreductase domain-containing protein [Kickxella alabastrina]KAJ1947861.1 hypothetical protein GGF37_000008 [Kickxella alabastrina]